MSFGYGVGDIILVTQLAWKCVQNAREACGNYNELTREVEGLHALLSRIQREKSNQDSLFNHPDESREEQLRPLLENCDIVLSGVDAILQKYTVLREGNHSKGKKVWQSIKFGNAEMQDLIQLRQKMAHHTQALSFFCSLMNIGSQGRVEKFIRSTGDGMQDINEKLAQILYNTQKPEGSIFTDYPDDDLSVWKGFRRELILDGYNSSFIQRNFEDIIRGMKSLDDLRVLDKSLEPRIELRQWRAIESPAQWQLVQSVWQDDLSRALAYTSLAANPRQQKTLLKGATQPEFVTEDIIQDDLSKALAHTSLAADLRQQETFLKGASQPEFVTEDIVQDDTLLRGYWSTTAPISSHEQSVITGSSGPYKSCLRRLAVSASGHSSVQQSVSIIVIPEISDLGVECAPNHWKWLNQAIKHCSSSSEVLFWEHNYGQRKFMWDDLRRQSHELLDSILKQDKAFWQRPLIFICHGLGGMIAKGVIHYGNRQTSRFGRFLNLVSGIVFLGTPHITYQNKESWPSLIDLLRYVSKFPKAVLSQAELETNSLADTCREFEDIGMSVPVISTYETVTSKVNTRAFRSRYSLLVDLKLATTSMKMEAIVPVVANHRDICHFDTTTEIYQHIVRLLTDAKRLNTYVDNVYTVPGQIPLTSQSAYEADDGRVDAMAASSRDGSEIHLTGILTVIHDTSIPEILKRPFFHVPYQSPRHFYGRTNDLDRIGQVLSPNISEEGKVAQKGSPCVVISGLGGIGKTHLALEYTYRARARYDAVFWVNAETVPVLSSDFLRISKELGLMGSSELEDRVVARSMVLKWLRTTKASWLLVFDNVENTKILHDFWPTSSNGSILITSRDRDAANRLYESEAIDLEPLATEESVDLLYDLTRFKRNEDNDIACIKIAHELQGLPLAISHMAAYITFTAISLQEFIEFYGRGSETIDSEDMVREPYSSALHNVWTVTFNSLSQESSALLGVLSLLHPDHVPQWMLRQKIVISNGTWLERKGAYAKGVKSLIVRCLVNLDKEADALSTHRQVQVAAISRMSTLEIYQTFTVVVDIIWGCWSKKERGFTYQSAETRSKLTEVLPHVMKIKNFYESRYDWLLESATLKSFAALLRASGWHLVQYAQYGFAHSVLTLAHKICVDAGLSSTSIFADILYCLATLRVETNQKSSTILRFALEHFDLRASLNDETEQCCENLSMAHCRLAQAYLINGDYQNSVTHCQSARELLGSRLETCIWFQWSQIYEAWCYIALADYEAAETLILSQYQYQLENVSSENYRSFMLASTLKCMGTLRMRQQLLEESFAHSTEALQQFTNSVGQFTYEASLMCTKVGIHHIRLDQFQNAEIFLERAMEWFSVHEFYAPEVTYVSYQMAILRKAQGDHVGANEYMAKTEKLYSKVEPSYDGKRWLSDGDINSLLVLTSR